MEQQNHQSDENATDEEQQSPPAIQRYKCHKVVEAFQIKEVKYNGGAGGAILTGMEGHTATVNGEYVKKHDPKPGGYYVRYEAHGGHVNYESWSPADAFEAGYSLIEEKGDSDGGTDSGENGSS